MSDVKECTWADGYMPTCHALDWRAEVSDLNATIATKAAELAAAQQRIAELEQWQRDMVAKAAEKSLDGYRELERRAATAEAQAERYRAALEAVIEHAESDPSDLCVIVDEIARAALAATAPPEPSDPEAVVIEAPIEPGGKVRKWVFEMTCDECDTTMTDLGDGDYKCLICEVDRRDLEAGR